MFPQTHKPTERMIDYGKIIYDHFKWRYRGNLQSGYRLYSEKRTASELPAGCFQIGRASCRERV